MRIDGMCCRLLKFLMLEENKMIKGEKIMIFGIILLGINFIISLIECIFYGGIGTYSGYATVGGMLGFTIFILGLIDAARDQLNGGE